MTMPIQEATLDDLPQLCALLAVLFAQEAEFQPDGEAQARGLRQIIEAPERGRILLLREAGRVLGMVSLLFSVSTALGARVAWLEDMIVAPAERARGLGSQLLRGAIAHARELGCRRITLLTDADNAAAQSFYQRHGFTVSAMRPMRLLLPE